MEVGVVAGGSGVMVRPPAVSMMQDAEVLACWFGGPVGRGVVLVLFPYGQAGEVLADELDKVLQVCGGRPGR